MKKMSVQQFCLRWNNHQPNFISVCSSLLHNGTLVDVTLAAEGRQLQAHKIVLSACSSYFQTLFTTNPCQHPIVILKDVQYNDLKTMVDFMYYGEVNVSQEQLPHILKTAEMLKIKGLAEMPADAATLTKSESKSSSDQTDQLQGSGSGAESIWGSTESQFSQHQQQAQVQQQPQHHHHHTGAGGTAGSHHSQQQQQQAQSVQSQQQQHQQQHQQQQQQHQHHHHHQQRRSPSPGSGASPAARRKRIRKSSNNGSTDRTSEDHSSVETSTNLNLSQMNQMTFGGSTSGGNATSLPQTIHAKLDKDSASVGETEHPHESSQESIDDSHQHHIQHIKPETDLNVQQSMPLDISGTTTPSDHDAPNVSCTQSQASHSGTRTLSPIRSVSGSSTSPSTVAAIMGSKRNRVLIRQPRVKRDSDSIHLRLSPDANPLEYELAAASGNLIQHQSLLPVPPRIERHASEPAPSLAPSSPHLLSVPSSGGTYHGSQPYLVKQHSHPLLLPSQQSSLITSGSLHGGHSTGISGYHPLHRQLSHPLSSTVTLSTISVAPITTVSPETSPCLLSSANLAPCVITTHTQVSGNSTGSSTASTLQYATTSGTTTASSLVNIKKETDNVPPPPPITKSHSSAGIILISEPLASTVTSTASLRVKSEELQRSVSSPQTLTRELSLDNPRSSHCPVIRPGPALGCNFCWNTIDAHGRILRRKTKYHCPECQTNLCIVPCFQEYHERQSTDTPSNNNKDNNNKFSSSSSGLRHYSKTESI